MWHSVLNHDDYSVALNSKSRSVLSSPVAVPSTTSYANAVPENRLTAVKYNPPSNALPSTDIARLSAGTALFVPDCTTAERWWSALSWHAPWVCSAARVVTNVARE